MTEMIALHSRGVNATLAAHPVSREEFKAYLHAIGRPIPAPLNQAGDPHAPVTYVSQVDASEYCRWLSAKEGRHLRLPRMAELHELADEITQEGINLEVWPHHHQSRPEFRGGMKPTFLCEWTQETDEIPSATGAAARRTLGSVFYPPWVRQGSNAIHAQAYLAATEGYSFVTFRLASDP